ncbi:MAG: C1 family peptidase, partial [Candidatus Eisenbacteria bacterium]|nr:C1 family peptidase [Candidatus Eisenbacteria bacterium]
MSRPSRSPRATAVRPAPPARARRTRRAAASAPPSRWQGAPTVKLAAARRVLNVPADPLDLRDREYVPTLAALPERVFHARPALVRDQGDEGACTGFAMAGVVNHLMAARRRGFDASPRFLYENARRYDEWKGDEYEGSSIRGAMKGFWKHGVCAWRDLPYVSGERIERIPDRARERALSRPLGAYFRVSTGAINDMQAAISEVGVVLASAQVHSGWDEPRVRKGARRGEVARIAWKSGAEALGGHAFAIVGYDADGFYVQNSWGRSWGTRGCALLTYEDWLANRQDAWVCQLGVGHVAGAGAAGGGMARAAGGAFTDEEQIRGHYLAIQDGTFDTHAPFRSAPEDLDDIARRIAAFARPEGGRKVARVMLFAHGGLVGESGAAARTLESIREHVPNGVYPLHFIWHTGLLETVQRLLPGQQADVTPVAGWRKVMTGIADKIADAADETLELLLRPAGRPIWDAMKNFAVECCHGPGRTEEWLAAGGAGDGLAFQLLDRIRDRCAAAGVTVHWNMVGHSAGSIFHCRLFDWFVRRNETVRSVSFLAPAVSCATFADTIMAHDGLVKRFSLHTMPDGDERSDHCAHVYHKSLLYLVSQSFERGPTSRLLGLARHVDRDFKGRTN